jgi:hypothetical protein
MTVPRGEVVLAWIPHTAGTRGKRRPAVVIQADSYRSASEANEGFWKWFSLPLACASGFCGDVATHFPGVTEKARSMRETLPCLSVRRFNSGLASARARS